jgi:hypothetical protein
MKWALIPGVAAVSFVIFTGCGPCLEKGKNGVPDPEGEEFQLVFNNIVSRESELTVDNLDDGQEAWKFTLCEETEYITVGNFPISTQTTIKIHSMVSDSDCYVSPCCTSDCGAQVCYGPPVVDTTPFAGRVYGTGLVWRYE